MRIHWLCIHVHVAMYPPACGCVSTCTWPWIHLHVAVFPRGFISTCKWPWIHVQNLLILFVQMAVYPRAHGHVSTLHVTVYPCSEFGYVLCHSTEFLKRLWATVQRRILLCTMDYSAELCWSLWAAAKNFVNCYGPQPRMIDHSAESHGLYLKDCPNLKEIVRPKIVHLYTESTSKCNDVTHYFLLLRSCQSNNLYKQ